MQRYFSREPVVPNNPVVLREEDRHHLGHVMRAKTGMMIEIVGPDHVVYQGEVVGNPPTSWQVVARRSQSQRPNLSQLPNEVTVACGLSKNDKLDWIVQKGTELGMAAFQPLQLHRDVVRWTQDKQASKINRLGKIAQAAAKQSKRISVPTILPLVDLMTLLSPSFLASFDWLLLAYEETAKQGNIGQLKTVFRQLQPGEKVLVVCGSEGGITEEEAKAMMAAGFLPCSLGPRILRAETAPLYILSALSYQTELR